MLNMSKSGYCEVWQCPKIAWMRKYKPEELQTDSDTVQRMEEGKRVGDLAKGLFGDFVEVTAYNGDKLDISKMIENTKLEMARGTQVICEAIFEHNGLRCAVDILKAENGGWAIYEVKSSTHGDKPVYIADAAYQKYVLGQCGVNVTAVYIVTLDSSYVFDGTLDIKRLFKTNDVSDAVKSEEEKVEADLDAAEKLLSSADEPNIDLHKNCKTPYVCGFWNYCAGHLPQPSVFDLYNMPFGNKIERYKNGQISFSDLLSDTRLNEKQLRQVTYGIYDKGTYIEKENIRAFLNTLSYPIYFLDFETFQSAVPEYVGTGPYDQIPFQYSLHYIEHEGGELGHKEFLAESGTDPRRAIAERLAEDIPADVCVVAYNKSFECSVIKNLASAFPDLAEHLLNIGSNIYDLIVPFRSGYYYNRAMGGSFSIKSVLPAIFPNDPALDYHNLEGVHNGSEAMSIFPKIKDMPPEEQQIARYNLLRYCELDTYAMVKVWEELVRVAG